MPVGTPGIHGIVRPRQVMNNATFRERCCEFFQCSEEECAEKILWYCMYPSSLRLARFMWSLDREYFGWDFALIDEVSDTTSLESLQSEVEEFRYHNRARGLLRGVLKIRISGQRLLNLGGKLYRSGKLERHVPATSPQTENMGRVELAFPKLSTEQAKSFLRQREEKGRAVA